MFQRDKKAFYRSVFEDANTVKEPPKEEEVREFWGGKIWGDADKYKGQPDWYKEIEKSYKNVKQQEWERITDNEIRSQLMRSMNWKAPGIDSLSNFWLKHMPCCYKLLADTMNEYIEKPEIMPDWVVRGRTVEPRNNGSQGTSCFYPVVPNSGIANLTIFNHD